MNTTTRRFARTTQEAFAVDQACALERPSRADALGGVLLACAIGIGLALALVHWWSA